MELLESNLSPARAANLCGEYELSQSTLSNNDTFQSNLMPSPSIPNIRMDEADDTFEKINICATLMTDQKIDSDDVAMLWIEWRSLNDPLDPSDRFTRFLDMDFDSFQELIQYHRQSQRHPFQFDISFNTSDDFSINPNHKSLAEKYCRSDFYKAVAYYGKALKWCESCDDILELIDGEKHFGEPLIALKYSTKLTDAERRAIQILNINNEEHNQYILRPVAENEGCYESDMQYLERVEQTKVCKRHQSKNLYKTRTKMNYSQKHRKVQKQYSYYRSRQ